MSIRDVIASLEKIAPPHLAEKWDNVGLLLGDARSDAVNIMTCLTVTQAVVDEALQQKVSLIVSHHPVLFKPVQRITTQTDEGSLLWQLARHNIAVYSPHTAYDNAEGGINDQLAQLLSLQNVQPLVSLGDNSQCKLVVFVPATDLEKVSAALFDAGCGLIGNYRQCSFRLMGTGTFWGNESSKPAVGHSGQLEQVDEVRLEVVCPAEQVDLAVASMRKAHSYEEPAFDVYPLHVTAGASLRGGSGRCGWLPSSVSPEVFARQVASVLKSPVTLTGQAKRLSVSKVGIVCGAGGSMLQSAVRAGCDAFLTGEIRFHDELSAQTSELTVVAAGHYVTERPGVERLALKLAEALPACKVWASCAEQNPAIYVTFD